MQRDGSGSYHAAEPSANPNPDSRRLRRDWTRASERRQSGLVHISETLPDVMNDIERRRRAQEEAEAADASGPEPDHDIEAWLRWAKWGGGMKRMVVLEEPDDIMRALCRRHGIEIVRRGAA